jgi:hypothetical protein
VGADLIVSLIEIEKDKEPDWSKARSELAKLTEDEAADAVANAKCVSLSELESEDSGPFLPQVQQAFEEVYAGWIGHHRFFTRLDGAKTNMLITGDRTWGDPVDECESLALFVESGLANVAGFIV